MLRKTIIFIIFLAGLGSVGKSQNFGNRFPSPDNIVQYKLENGDTVYMARIREVYIFPKRVFTSEAQRRHYGRLVRNVKKVYPYAVMAREKYYAVAAHLQTLQTEKEKRDYIKQVEQEIKDDYEDDLKGLTITQGRILLKLIDRETGETSYDLLKEYKGSFNAVFWQTLARIFGNNLKSEFNANGDDAMINEIIVLIENGQL